LIQNLKGPIFPLPIRTIDANDVTSTYTQEQIIHPRCVPINPIDSGKFSIVDREEYNEEAALMNKHGFNNVLNNYGTNNDNDNDNKDYCNFEMGDDNIDDDIPQAMNPNLAVTKGYTTSHPTYTE